MIMRRIALLTLTASLSIGVIGCSKQEQTAEANKNGKYAGKPDTRPWESEKTAFTDTKLAKGDKTAWESAIKARNQSQNEYAKTQ